MTSTSDCRADLRWPTMEVELTPKAPYAFAHALDYIRASPSAVIERVSDAGEYARAVRLDGRPALLRLRSVGTVEAPQLILHMSAAELDLRTVEAATALARHIFALDVDPVPFEQMAERAGDPVFVALVRRYRGMRPVLIADPFEALIWAIIGQQVNVSFARKLKLALVALAGETLVVDGEAWPLTPIPGRIAALSKDALRERQFSRQKARYIIGLARAAEEGTLDLPALANRPHEDAIAALTCYTGVGRWTAEYVLMRGLGARDSIPAADMGLRAIIGQRYGLGRNASEDEVRALAERWTGWRGWAAFHWWHELQLESQAGPR